MNNDEYDLERLRRFDEINVESALKNFSSQQEFFDALTLFTQRSPEYLTKYSAYKVSAREESRRGFMLELKNLRELFTSLGMEEALIDLKYLETAAFNKDTDALGNELNEFYGRMEKISKFIISVRVAAPAAERHLILAVDDMPALLSSVVKMLDGQYEVMAVTSGKAALKVIEKHNPSLFLLDIEMPMMNGYELAAMIRINKKFEYTPIIFLTAKGGRDDVLTAIRHGGNDYIIKPVDKDLLLSKIQRFLP